MTSPDDIKNSLKESPKSIINQSISNKLLTNVRSMLSFSNEIIVVINVTQSTDN